MKRLSLLLFVAVLACGKRGDPHPPVPVIPKATSDLVVTQRGAKVVLAWSYPSLSTAGKKLDHVRRVVVYRYSESLPVPAAGRDPKSILPGDIDTTIPRSVALFAKVPTLSAAQFLKLREKVDSIEDVALPEATSGAKLTFEDGPALHTTDARAVRLSYAVVTESESASGAISNLATIVPLDVPKPPSAVTATAKAQGVVIAWSAGASAKTEGELADPSLLAGYNIYRADSPTSFPDLEAPLNAAPVRELLYTDTPPYGTYSYRVSAVALAGPPRIESDPSESASATYKDLLPPPAPASVTALVETKAVRLVWDAVDAADLKGYRVYRTEGTARLLLTPGPTTQTNFRDISIDPGISYFYTITSVDKSGNESAPVKSDNILVPKTP